ncbi:unnamed protein product [Rotaria magnacalcarata]|uniref:WD repeat-containing protein 90 n=3 Tax=Rotaria magnacalcarata TaxID=392030 RepID=A0A816P6A5_9BILA|nr:unnamed protein product [Rotaria magnacalcarata]
MSSSSWQHPFVNIFKHFDINSAKKCVKNGDVSTFIDRDLKSIVYRIRGLVPANNYIQFPSESLNQSLCLTGRLYYLLFRPMFDKCFCIHIDILTYEKHLIRISLSNLYRELKVTQASIQFPYMTTGTDIHWSVLCLDLHTILLTYMTNEHYHMIKSFQLCGNMFVKNCFTSQFLYEPGIDSDTAKRTGLTRAGIRSLPRELSFPMDKSQSWHDRYDFIMFPNTTSSVGKNPNEPFDKVGNVRLPTPKKLKTNESNEIDHDELLPLTAQTTLVNGKLSRSITDLSLITNRSVAPGDLQLNWRTYNNPVDRFPLLPIINDSSTSSPNNDGIHLFVNPESSKQSSSSSIADNSDYDLTLTMDHTQQSHNHSTLLPDPILRLQTVIGLTSSFNNFLWTHDGNYVIYSANAIVVQMHIETQQQWFFIGHTDKISSIAFNSNSSLLATIQTGLNVELNDNLIFSLLAILRLWKFESRRCISAIRVPNTHDLHALDFSNGTSSSSSSLVVAGHDEQTHTVICVYNVLNVSKYSIELTCRATTNVSITHIRFIPYDTTKFVSIGLDKICLWRIRNGNDLKSINILTNDTDRFEYTDLQFQQLSNHKLNEVIAYVATKTGQILELLYDERRVIRIHHLSDKVTMSKGSAFSISALTCTNNFFITGSTDGYIRVWSIDFSQVYIEAKYDRTICGLVSSYDQTRIFIVTVSGSMNILNLVTKLHSNLTRTHTKFISDIDYDDTKKQLISAGQDGTIRIWCFQTGKQLSEFTSEREIPLAVAYAPNRKICACGFNNGTIKIFDLNTSIILYQVKHHTVSVTGLLYSHNGSYLLSSDEQGDLCLSDATDSYKLYKTIVKAIIRSEKGSIPLSLSADGKYAVYIGPTEFIVTIIETNSLNETLRIDINDCTLISSDAALFARFTPTRYLYVATVKFKLLKFDSYTGKLLQIIDNVHKRSFDSLALSSNGRYLITGGDGMLKFWDADMKLDKNFQNFICHSGPIRKIFFTDDNMHVVSIGDSLLIWNVLAWNTSRPTMPNNAQCIVSPQLMMTKILENTIVRSSSDQSKNSSELFQCSQQKNESNARPITRSLSNLEIGKTVTMFQEEKKIINQKLLTKQTGNDNIPSPPSIRRHFVQRTNHSQLAKKRYIAPKNQESLKLQAIIGYNGNGRENLVWHANTGFYAYTVGCHVIVEDLTTNHQTILTGKGHTEEISTITLSHDATMLVSAQCSISIKKEEPQTRVIVWDTKTLRHKTSFNVSARSIQSMTFSKDDHFLATVGNYRKSIVTIWYANHFTRLVNWQDENSSFYINCLAWNPIRMNDFCLGGTNGGVRFCTINEQTDDGNLRLQVVQGQIPILLHEHSKPSFDVTACIYLTSIVNLVLCATNNGFITCWNSRLCLCVLHWKADSSEICYLITTKYKLLTGSSTGCLKLWDIESLETNLGQSDSIDSNHGLKLQDEFQLDDGIISGSFDNTFDMGIIGTLCGSIWYICWTTDRSKTRLVASHTNQITGLIPIEDTHIVTSSTDGTIRIFQLDDRNEILRFNTNGLEVTCLTSWDNSMIRSIVAGYNDGTVRVFSLLHEQMQLKLQPHTSSITTIHIPLHTMVCLSGALDGSVAISNLTQGTILRVLNEHHGLASICTIDSKRSLNNNFYTWLITSHDQRVSLWKSNQQFEICSLVDWLMFSKADTKNHWQSSPPCLARFIETNLILFTGYDKNQSIGIYDIGTKQIIRTIAINQWCSCFDFSTMRDKNSLIAIGTKDRLIQLRDYTQETFQDFIGNNDSVSNIKFNKSNDLLITTSSNEILVWKIIFK